MNNVKLQLESHSSIREMEAIKDKWNQAVLSSSGEISLTYEWFRALEESHFDGKKLHYLTAYREGRLQGILPIIPETTFYCKCPVRKLSFISNAYCNHNDLILDTNAESEMVLGQIMPALKEYTGSWHVLEIDEVMVDSPRMAALERVCRELGYPVLKWDISNSPYIPLGPDFDLVYRTLRSGDSRRKIRKLEESLHCMEGFQIQYVSKPEAVTQVMETVLKIERASWKAGEKTDIASHPQQILFYTRFAELAAASGWLNIALLSTASESMAYEYNLRFGKKCFHLKGSYNSGFKDRSPSKVLKKEVLRTCCEGGLEEYDYTGQEQEHKLEWTDKMRRHQRWVIFNRGWYGQLLSKIGAVANRMNLNKDQT